MLRTALGAIVAAAMVGQGLASADVGSHVERQSRGTTTYVTTAVSATSSGRMTAGRSPSMSSDGRFVAYTRYAPVVWDRLTGKTTRVNGGGIEDQSSEPAISNDGRYVAYTSDSGKWVPGDINSDYDVFLWDRATGSTVRVSKPVGADVKHAGSSGPDISADGRFVVFSSEATNMVAGDTNGVNDVFVWDRLTATNTRISVATDGTQGNATTGQPGRGGYGSYAPAISADGRMVSFVSESSNLVPGDTNGESDVMLRDRQNSTTVRVSVASDGTQADSHAGALGDRGSGHTRPAISSDGTVVAFDSLATNLVPNDTNRISDVFVWDSATSTTRRASVASNGAQADRTRGGTSGYRGSFSPSLSADGRHVAYSTYSSNLVAPVSDKNRALDVVVWDSVTGATRLVSMTDRGKLPEWSENGSSSASISGSGQFVAYSSWAVHLVPGDSPALGSARLMLWNRSGGLRPRSLPGKPRSLVAERVKADEVKIRFTKPKGNGGPPVNSYEARCKRKGAPSRTSVAYRRVAIVTRVARAQVTCQVRARNIDGWSKWSVPVRV